MWLANKFFEHVILRILLFRQYDSASLRRYFKLTYNIDIGAYSYGCFDRWRIPPGTSIGRYCSFAKTARVLDANHPMESISTHPFLYDPSLGIVSQSRVKVHSMVIEDDVWVSHNATLTASTGRVGRGAIIGAGAIVTHEVPPYAVVAGVPAKVLRYRFDEATIAAIEKSRWWLLDKQELQALVKNDPDFCFRPMVRRVV